jgi:hypothetical protein
MRAEHPHDEITRLELERLALGRLDPQRAADIEAMGTRDPALAARVERVRGEIQAASAGLPPLALPGDAERHGRLAWLRRPALWAPALAVVLALALVIVLPPGEPAETWRGGAVMDIELLRVRLGEAQPQGALVSAQAGDRLQIEVSPPQAGWIQIYDLQNDGRIQAWLEPRRIGARQRVEQAVLLDDYPGAERLFVLLSPEPISLQQVEQAADQAFRTPLVELDLLPGLGDGVLQRSVLIVKETGS